MNKHLKILLLGLAILASTTIFYCGKSGGGSALSSNAASKVYVAPGEKDEVYLFTSGGFSGQMGVYGIPSGRLFRQIPVFSRWAENGYGYDDIPTT